MQNSGCSLDKTRQHSHGASWSRRCFSISRGPSPSPDETGVSPCTPMRSALYCSGASRLSFRIPVCGELLCFRHQFLRLLNGFSFLRIHACRDLSSFTCVWHTFMVSHFCHARRSVFHGSATLSRNSLQMMASDALRVCSQLLMVTVSSIPSINRQIACKCKIALTRIALMPN